MEALLIARYFPGLGSPWGLTLAQWNGTLDRLADVVEMENPGDPSDPATVERKLDRMKRKAQREKAHHARQQREIR